MAGASDAVSGSLTLPASAAGCLCACQTYFGESAPNAPREIGDLTDSPLSVMPPLRPPKRRGCETVALID